MRVSPPAIVRVRRRYGPGWRETIPKSPDRQTSQIGPQKVFAVDGHAKSRALRSLDRARDDGGEEGLRRMTETAVLFDLFDRCDAAHRRDCFARARARREI